jgi:hypothetical protein
LYGSNVKGINEALELELMSLAGEITFEEVKPLKTMDSLDGSHTQKVNADLDLHSDKSEETSRKHEKQDLVRFSVRNVKPKSNKGLMKFLIEEYGTVKGNLGSELSRIMDQYVKVKTGVLCIVKTGKNISNNISESNLVKVLEDFLQRKLEPVLNKFKRSSSKRSSRKTIKPASKGAKADTVLFALMNSR